MSQAMFDEAEEISVNGKPVKTAATWSLYNPAAMVLADKRSVNLICPGDTASIEWYNTHLFGYPGQSMHRYLTDDRELVMDAMKTAIVSKDELIFAHWMYNVVKDKGDLNKQLAYQMPEDFLVSFGLGEQSLVDEHDQIMTKAILQLEPVQKLSAYDLELYPGLSNAAREEVIPVYFMKPLFLWLLRTIARDRGLRDELLSSKAVNLPSLFMDDIYQIYMEKQSEYWEKLEDENKTNWITSTTTTGFIPGGKKYTLTAMYVNINIL